MEAKVVPDLAAPVAKHRTALQTLETQKEAALDVPRKSYLASLADAAASEAKGGKPSVLKTINEEIAAVKGGGIPLEIPKELPRDLRTPRKAFLDAGKKVFADFAARQEKVDAEYLRALGSLKTKAASDPALTEQIMHDTKALANPNRTLGITFVSASYQGHEGQGARDVTQRIKDGFASGAESMVIEPGSMGGDPHPYNAKQLVLNYNVGAVLKTKTLRTGTITFRDLVK